MTRYRCPICKVEADIVKKKIVIYIGRRPPRLLESFPLHFDCELAKARPDLSKLEKV